MSVGCECCVLSGRVLCDELITRPEESYRLWCVWVWSRNLMIEETLAHLGSCCAKRKTRPKHQPHWQTKLDVMQGCENVLINQVDMPSVEDDTSCNNVYPTSRYINIPSYWYRVVKQVTNESQMDLLHFVIWFSYIVGGPWGSVVVKALRY